MTIKAMPHRRHRHRRLRQRGRGRGRAATSVGYTEAETEASTRAWVDTSHDPVVGNGQKKSTYRQRIKEAYAAIKPNGTPERNEQMLRTHWDRVEILLAEFQQLYKDCEMKMGSGQSELDVVKDSPNFTTVFSAKFKLDEAAKRTKTRVDGSYTTSASESGRSTPYPERPKDRDAAKGKRKVGSSSSMDSEMSEAHLAAAELHAMKLENATAAMQAAVKSFNIINTYPILMKDTSTITPDEKARHEEYVR